MISKVDNKPCIVTSRHSHIYVCKLLTKIRNSMNKLQLELFLWPYCRHFPLVRSVNFDLAIKNEEIYSWGWNIVNIARVFCS